ncbi:MAG: hypothetical protein CFH06_02024, partial [Alphaproteobacteria bacterium MarineAlpha3_Bin5]
NFETTNIIFTGSGQRESDLTWIAQQGIQINVDSLHQLELLSKSAAVKKVSIRLNNDVGEGHHNHGLTHFQTFIFSR